ncbi:MAG: trypsin-like peptidase domain-containing protein [Planctomycetaceae bacterium]
MACTLIAGAAAPARQAADLAEPAEAAASPVDDYFAVLAEPDGRERARELAETILRDHADDALTLDSLAWGILTDDALPHRDVALAVRAARRAHELTGGDDAEVLETLARALVTAGDRAEGLALHRRAIELSADDPSTRLVLLEILSEYERPPADPGPTDDERLRRLEDALRGLVASGHAVPVDDLLSRAGVEPIHVDVLPPADRPLRGDQLFERVRQSVVVMAGLEPRAEEPGHDLSLATGFVIHPAGLVVTNYHVVDLPGAPALAAQTPDGTVHPVTEILAVSPFADIAICRLGGVDGLVPLPLLADARPGLRLHALSHPDGALYSLTEGILSRSFVHRADGQAKTMFTTTVDFAVGSSGGPLVDDRGNVVGMVSSTLAVYAGNDDAHAAGRGDASPGDFQMGLNMCVPAADILRLTRAPAGGPRSPGRTEASP